MRHHGMSGILYRVVFLREMRSLAAVGGSEWIGGVRDDTVGVQKDGLSGDELDPVVFVLLIFGSMFPGGRGGRKSCDISIRTWRRCLTSSQ